VAQIDNAVIGGMMKKIPLMVMILVVLSVLSANVIDPRFIARVWFDESDACFVMFGDEAWWEGFEVNDCCFTTSAGSYYLPPDYVQPSESVFVINLSQEIPDFTIQRNMDFLRLTNPDNPFFFTEELRWGPQNDTSVHMHALEPGQSAVHVYAPAYAVHGHYDTGRTWAKDNQIDSPDPYNPASNYTLRVHLEDPSGTPAPNIPVYSSYFDYAAVYDHYYNNATDSSGNWERTNDTICRSILVKDPQTQDTVIQELLFPEPGETIQINGVISQAGMPDPEPIPQAGILRCYPSILSRSTGSSINLKYESDIPLGQQAKLAIYDLRGRYLYSKKMPTMGETVWALPGLSSGIYFIALKDSDKILARSKITVYK